MSLSIRFEFRFAPFNSLVGFFQLTFYSEKNPNSVIIFTAPSYQQKANMIFSFLSKVIYQLLIGRSQSSERLYIFHITQKADSLDELIKNMKELLQDWTNTHINQQSWNP